MAIVQRLAVRSDWLGGWPDLAKNMSLEDIIPLIHFHRSVIEPLTERYATWALAALSSGSYPQSHPLGGVEGPRIHRALYRLEVFCNLSRFRGEGRSAPVYLATTLKDLNHLKLCPELQIEEVLCIHAFARDVYSNIFDQVARDLVEPRNPSDPHGSSLDPCKPTYDLPISKWTRPVHAAMPSPTSGR